MVIEIARGLSIPEDSVVLRFIRAGGPGGQNVNKVASAVQLRFDPLRCPQLNDAARARLARLAGRRCTDSGEIVLTAQRLRTQESNRRDALQRLAELIEQALIEPKARRASRPTRASKERRLQNKSRRGAVKGLRGRVDSES